MTAFLTLPLDQDQRKIVREELGASLVVEAGAGTGKTTLLIDRLIELVCLYGLENIAAITFTEKATAELTDRLRKELEMRVMSPHHKPHYRQVMKALDEIDSANLSTIHSFAASIIREGAIPAGIDPEFTHVDPGEEDLLLKGFFSAAMRSRDNERDSVISRFLALGGTLQNLVDLGTYLNRNRGALDFIRGAQPSHDFQPLLQQLAERTRHLAGFARENCHEPSDKGFTQITEFEGIIPDMETASPEMLWKWLIKITGIKDKLGAKGNWHDGDSCSLFKSNIADLKAFARGILQQAGGETLEWLIRWTRGLIDMTQQHKKSRGLIGFDDMLLEARNLLRQRDSLEHFRSRYERLLIDEFQDTDPLQIEIALLLASSGFDVDRLFEGPLEIGKLCIVGDLKQSIYRFRRADPQLFRRTASLIARFGKTAQISQNFRSSKGVLDFVNRFFNHIWKVNSDSDDYQPITADPNRPEIAPEPPVCLIFPAEKDATEKQKADEVRSAEAHAIAHAVLKARKEGWTVYDAVKKIGSPIGKWSDFAVLFPTTTGIEFYADVLNYFNIPFQIEGGKRFYISQIISELYSCLSAIDNPLDRLNVIAALRSRFFGIPDAMIMTWHNLDAGSLDYRAASTALPPELRSALAVMRDLHTRRKSADADKTLSNLFEQTGIMPVLRSDRKSWRDASALERVLEIARDLAIEQPVSLRAFKRHFSDLIEKQDDPAKSSTSRMDSVRLMTVHAAKGLEFPVVFIANMQGYKYHKRPVITDYAKRKIEVSFSAIDRDWLSTGGYDVAYSDDQEADVAERMRLLYVAMTRARDHLILPMFFNTDKNGEPQGIYYKWLTDFLNSEKNSAQESPPLWREIIDPGQGSIPQAAAEPEMIEIDVPGVLKAAEDFAIDRQQRLKAAIDRLPVYHLPSDQIEDLGITGTGRSKLKPPGTALQIGRAFHNYIARCDISLEVDFRLIEYAATEEGLPASELESLVKNCLESSLWREVNKAGNVWRETPVIAEASGKILKGVIDLIWTDEGGRAHSADFKTGAKDIEGHRSQLLDYAKSFEQATGMAPASLRLFYVRTNEEIFVTE